MITRTDEEHKEIEKVARLSGLKKIEIPLDNKELLSKYDMKDLGKKSVLTDFYSETNTLVAYIMQEEDAELLKLIQKPDRTSDEEQKAKQVLLQSFQNMIKNL